MNGHEFGTIWKGGFHLDILKHFEMLKRKFNSGIKSRLQLSYMSEELSGPMLKKIVLETVVDQLHLMIAEFAEEMDLHAVMMEEMEEA